MPEGMFLIDAVLQTAAHHASRPQATPWWALTERVLWALDLFARLENRERMHS